MSAACSPGLLHQGIVTLEIRIIQATLYFTQIMKEAMLLTALMVVKSIASLCIFIFVFANEKI